MQSTIFLFEKDASGPGPKCVCLLVLRTHFQAVSFSGTWGRVWVAVPTQALFSPSGAEVCGLTQQWGLGRAYHSSSQLLRLFQSYYLS